MTVDEYLAWTGEHPGRYELLDGAISARPSEGAGHAEKKAAVHAALLAGIRTQKLACHALPDGMTVRIDDTTAYEPDALVASDVPAKISIIKLGMFDSSWDCLASRPYTATIKLRSSAGRGARCSRSELSLLVLDLFPNAMDKTFKAVAEHPHGVISERIHEPSAIREAFSPLYLASLTAAYNVAVVLKAIREENTFQVYIHLTRLLRCQSLALSE